jgi:L,D-transpeptidase catalytic domain
MRFAWIVALSLFTILLPERGVAQMAQDAGQAPGVAAEAPAAEVPPVAVAAPPPPPKPITLVAKIDLTHQQMTVSQNGRVTHSWPISSGTRDFPSPAGTYKAQWVSKMWYSRKYDDAPMPHAVFFHEGAAVHATTAMHMLGQPASHGCIRLAPRNAEIFYNLVIQHTRASTEISLFGKPRWPAPAVARGPQGPGPGVFPRYAVVQRGYAYPYGVVVQAPQFRPAPWQNTGFVAAGPYGASVNRTR